jgi:glucose/mannose-6-phosphate isomerase
VTTGGKLRSKAEELNGPSVVFPLESQPRLLTGYLMAIVLKVLVNCNLVPDFTLQLVNAFSNLDKYLDEDEAKSLASLIFQKVPIVFGVDNNPSLAHSTKIKFNENSKTQSYWNVFPELNHNEMVGYTNVIMPIYFLIFKSKFSHARISKRIEIFKSLMEKKGIGISVIELKGDDLYSEIMNAYYLVDHITYYLADKNNVDPEPVLMVEEFKKLLEK